MRKLKPSYPLGSVRELIDAGETEMTGTAVKDAHELGFSETEVMEIIKGLTVRDFCKSETDFHNRKVWQDYYKTRARKADIFIKLKIVEKSQEKRLLVLSFKRDKRDAGGAEV